jgi:Leucine-rich repeat (LRR) protein
LYIDFQPFNHIFAGIGETFPNSQYLFVSDQQIKFVERANFEHLEKLEVLYLNNNEIKHLPKDVFWDLTNLEYLDLSNNKIAILSDKIFMHLKRIVYIDLENNRIRHFPSNLLARNSKLKFFYSAGNPRIKTNADIRKILKVNF